MHWTGMYTYTSSFADCKSFSLIPLFLSGAEKIKGYYIISYIKFDLNRTLIYIF